MARRDFTVKLDKATVDNVERMVGRLLSESRRQAPKIVKQLARMSANSAAKMTLPSKDSIGGSPNSRHRMPKDKDKFRPVVPAKEMGHGNFYAITSVGLREGRRKRRGHRHFTGGNSQRRVMRGTRGELIIYTTKKISQKDTRFRKVTKLVKAFGKKTNKWYYMPTLTKKKYDKDAKAGKIPYYFAAKMAWLWSSASVTKSITRLNKDGRLKRLGTSYNNLSNKDNPSVTLINSSKYAHKQGGKTVPRRAIAKALRGYGKMLEKKKQLIANKAKGV